MAVRWFTRSENESSVQDVFADLARSESDVDDAQLEAAMTAYAEREAQRRQTSFDRAAEALSLA